MFLWFLTPILKDFRNQAKEKREYFFTLPEAFGEKSIDQVEKPAKLESVTPEKKHWFQGILSN